MSGALSPCPGGRETLYYDPLARSPSPMRWFVDVTPLQQAGTPERYCFEADQWQSAVNQARIVRGDDGPAARAADSDDGRNRVVDDTRGVEYLATRAPDDTPLTPKAVPSPRPPSRTVTSTTQRSFQAVTEPDYLVVKERAESPTDQAPVTYREYAYAVEPGTPRDALKILLWSRFQEVGRSIEDEAAGKFIQLAVYDHTFSGRPNGPPLATLMWKDWRGEPVIHYAEGAARGADVRVVSKSESSTEKADPSPTIPERVETSSRAAPTVPTDPPTLQDDDADSRPAPSFPIIEVASEDDPGVPSSLIRTALEDDGTPERARKPTSAATESTHAEATTDTEATAVADTEAAPARRTDVPSDADDGDTLAERSDEQVTESPLDNDRERPDRKTEPVVEATPSRHEPGDDLIGELFDSMHDLHFMPHMVAGVEFVLEILARTIPCEATVVHVFDIDTRDFVVVRAKGPGSHRAVLHRTPDLDPFFQSAMRRSVAQRVDASSNERYHQGVWEKIDCEPDAALFGPVHLGGRFLGAVELVNPEGGGAFYESETHAVDYICEQLAEFLASRPLVLEDDVVLGTG